MNRGSWVREGEILSIFSMHSYGAFVYRMSSIWILAWRSGMVNHTRYAARHPEVLGVLFLLRRCTRAVSKNIIQGTFTVYPLFDRLSRGHNQEFHCQFFRFSQGPLPHLASAGWYQLVDDAQLRKFPFCF